VIKNPDAPSWNTYILIDGTVTSIVFDCNDESRTKGINRALAVVRLRTSLNFVGCSTGIGQRLVLRPS